MKLAFFVCIALAIAAKRVHSQTCHLREVDLCVAIGMFHYQSNGFPPDEEKVNDWCETMTEVQDCIGNFSSKCLSPLQREMISLISGSGEAAQQLCTEGSDIRAQYLQHSECLADGADSDEFKTQVKDLQVAIESLFDTEFKKRFPLMCCSFRRFHEETEAMAETRCGAASVNMLRGIMKMITTDLPETVCQQFNPHSDECKSLLPPTGTPSRGAENKSQLGKLLDTVLGNL